ncbi:replication protein A 70 kDa DNA-binding subunit B-like [Rutidosis leptorrhynchoides]|uniref:replication protein A 70 kDa DNA-binding subunit B-like n=1 Tax=Rutidosis leptorrhynchoides TaxID=125765 RepID=UPI003A99385C
MSSLYSSMITESKNNPSWIIIHYTKTTDIAMALPIENNMAQGGQRTYVYLHELQLGEDAVVKVMICRTWDTHSAYGKYLSTDFIASDEKVQNSPYIWFLNFCGGVIQLTAKSTVAHCFIPRLKEGSVYLLKNFEVVPNRDSYRILRDNKFLIQLQGSTFLRRQQSAGTAGYIRHPFACIPFESLEATDGKYLIDVVGCVLNVGTPQNPKKGTPTLEFELANERDQRIRVTLWGNLGSYFLGRKPATNTCYCIILSSVSVKQNYYGTKALSSTSSTMIMDDTQIPDLSDFINKISGVEFSDTQEDLYSGRHFPPPKEGTLADLLALVRKGKNSAGDVFKCKIELVNIRMNKGWHYTTCSICKAKKGITRKFCGYYCESCAKIVPEPITRFRVQCDVRDATAETMVVFFDETAEQLTQTTAPVLLAEQDEETCTTVLPNALANLLGTTQVVLIKTSSYYEHGTFESFNCIKVYLDDPVPETPPSGCDEDVTVPTVAEPVTHTNISPSSASKGLKREIDVPTPAKDLERLNRRRFIVTTSDSDDDQPPAATNVEEKEMKKNA